MPARKKKSHPPVKSTPSRRKQPDNYELVSKVIVATIVSSVLMLSISAWLATNPQQAAAGSSRLFQFAPPAVGLLSAVLARPLRDFFHTSPSETIHAGLISALLSLLISGLVVLLS